MAQKRRLNLDYVNPLSDKTKLEIGLEARLFNTDAYYDLTGQSFDKNGGLSIPRAQISVIKETFIRPISPKEKPSKVELSIGCACGSSCR